MQEEKLRADITIRHDLRAMAFLRASLWALVAFNIAVGILVVLVIVPNLHPVDKSNIPILIAAPFGTAAILAFLAVLHHRRPSEGLGWSILAAEMALLLVDYITVYMPALVVVPTLTDKVPDLLGFPVITWFVTRGPAFLFILLAFFQISGIRAPGRIKARTMEPDDPNPWVRYYPVLAQLMVRVINVDAESTPQEERFFSETLDEWHLTDIQKRLVREACDESVIQNAELVQTALELGIKMGQDDPAAALLVRLRATAEADGPINPEERDLLLHLADLAGMDQEKAGRLLAA